MPILKKRYIAAGIVGALALAGAVTAYTLTPTVHEGSKTEVPELGRPGPYSIGTAEEQITLADRPVITATSTVTGSADPAPRRLRVRFWYPTLATDGDTAAYEHNMSRDADKPLPLVFEGRAIIDAGAVKDSKFPLVVISHGYGGWAEHLSFLGEHIASRGYVVTSIDHADARPDGAMSFLLSFGNVLQNRSLDQRQVIEHLVSASAEAQGGYLASIDATKIALIGYSMGGYGALRSAGAPHDYEGEGLSKLPEDSKRAMQADSTKAASETIGVIDALVAMAPWGGAPDNRSWTAEGLQQIKVPALVIAGNQDDVVDFDAGVQWLFENMKGSDRHLLVYREARHNIAGNAITDPDFPANEDFATAEYIREPVWRTERLNAINQHFITAFLDLHLKGDVDKRSYLNPPVENSNDGRWDLKLGEQLNGKLAGDEEHSYWRGFQNRWALGMEMRVKSSGE